VPCSPEPSIAVISNNASRVSSSSWRTTRTRFLFIDEIHTLIGAGAASGGTMDASNLLKPALSSGALKCIGATTYTEFRGVFEKDHALSRRFQKVDVNEPSVGETVSILRGLKSRFEEHHGVKYSAAAISSAAELSAKYINDRHLPDKAIDVIDEAGAAQRILPKSKQKKTIGKLEIEDIVAKIARIPPQHVSADDRSALKNLDRDLKNMVFGQDAAIDALAKAIKMSRSGLGDPQKPIGCFLFSGPTGVGKTEVARQLAYGMGIELIRFDMSEYMERHAVSRLIGAPPGYVGFDQGGLADRGRDQEAACRAAARRNREGASGSLQHPAAGDGPRHADRQQRAQGGLPQRRDRHDHQCRRGGPAEDQHRLHHQQGSKGDEMADIKRMFTPEFRNRLDAIISFRALDAEIILRVVDKFLMQLEGQLHEKKVEAIFTDALRAWLAEKGFDPLMGARPMARLIQDTIRSALADELLFGRLVHGGRVTIDLDEHEKAYYRSL
jgi:ATP-dependent Clp protease ATP-binding subunit ClpA